LEIIPYYNEGIFGVEKLFDTLETFPDIVFSFYLQTEEDCNDDLALRASSKAALRLARAGKPFADGQLVKDIYFAGYSEDNASRIGVFVQPNTLVTKYHHSTYFGHGYQYHGSTAGKVRKVYVFFRSLLMRAQI